MNKAEARRRRDDPQTGNRGAQRVLNGAGIEQETRDAEVGDLGGRVRLERFSPDRECFFRIFEAIEKFRILAPHDGVVRESSGHETDVWNCARAGAMLEIQTDESGSAL